MKALPFFIILLFTSCVSINNTPSKIDIEKSYSSSFGINAAHIIELNKIFKNEKNKIVRIFRSSINDFESTYDHSIYNVVIYSYEFSYTFRITYEIEFIKDTIVSCKEISCIFLEEKNYK